MTTYHRITSGDDLASLVGREQPASGWNVEVHGKVEGRDSKVERKPPTPSGLRGDTEGIVKTVRVYTINIDNTYITVEPEIPEEGTNAQAYSALERAAQRNGSGTSNILRGHLFKEGRGSNRQLTLVADEFALPGYRNLKTDAEYFSFSRPPEETRQAPQP